MKMNGKKAVFLLVFLTAVIFNGGCSPMIKAMESINGKDGLFAVIETSKGEIAVKLFYKEILHIYIQGSLDLCRRGPKGL